MTAPIAPATAPLFALPVERRVIGTPVKLSRTPWRVSGRVAAYGEDGDAVLRGAGFSDAEISALRAAGVLCGGA